VVQRNHHLIYKLGLVVLTADADLWVTENGTPVLLKIGVANKSRDFVDVLLTIIRKAALNSKYRVRRDNIVYLNIRTGEELISRGSLKRFNQCFLSAAKQIARVWPTIAPTEVSPAQSEGNTQPSA